MNALFQQYLARQRSKGCKARTIAHTRDYLDRFDRWVVEQGLDAGAISPVVVQGYVDFLVSQRLSPVTVKTHLTVIKAAYRYAVNLEHLDRNPCRLAVMPKVPDKEPETYSNAELRAILGAVRSLDQDLLIAGLVYTGLRRAEFCSLSWEDIDWGENQMRVLGKAGKLRFVPMHPLWRERLLHAERSKRDGQVYVVETMRKGPISHTLFCLRLQEIIDRAGVKRPRTPAHAFRRSVASSLFENEVQETVIDRILGWGARTVRERHYLRVSDQRLQQGILALYRDDPLEV